MRNQTVRNLEPSCTGSTRPWIGWTHPVWSSYIDETSFKKGHNYITLVCDQDKRIIFVCKGKSSETMNRLTV